MLRRDSVHGLFIRFQAVCLFLVTSFLPNGRYFFVPFFISELIFCIMYNGIRKIRMTLLEFIWVSYFAGWLFYNYDVYGAQRMMQFLILMLTFYINRYMTRCSIKDYIFLGKTASTVVLILFIMWGAQGFTFNRFAGYSVGSNNVGTILMHVIVALNVLSHVLKRSSVRRLDLLPLEISQVVGVVILFASKNRSSFLGLVVYFILVPYFNAHKQNNREHVYKIVTIALFITMLVFTVIYSSLNGTPFADMMNYYSRAYFNKQFFSGRNEMWPKMIEFITLSPFLGYGLQATPYTLINTRLSSHNIYIQTIIQCGIIGMFLLVAFIWRILRDISKTDFATEGFAYICCLITAECFSESITQVGFRIGCVAWLTLGIMAQPKGGNIHENTLRVSTHRTH